MHITKKKLASTLLLIALAAAPVFLIALDMESIGILCVVLVLIGSFFLKDKEYRIGILIIVFCLLILNSTPITTDTSDQNFLRMGLPLLFISFGVILGSRKFLKKPLPLRRWSKKPMTWTSVVYPLFAFVLAGLLIPRYFSINPEVPFHRTLSSTPSIEELRRLFRGSNFLGMWDELFFINVVFSLLRRKLSFWKANIIQACFFTSFLYELAFTGLGPFFIFPFALLQGYIFEKRESIGYIIIIHLLIDTALYLSIVSSHAPGWYTYFPWL